MDVDPIQQLRNEISSLVTQLMIEVLRRDASLQEQGNLDSLGENYEFLDWCKPDHSRSSAISWTFYDSWIDERNHNFVGHYEGIGRDDWPRHARYIADRLATVEEIADPVILSNFDLTQRRGCLPSLRGLSRRS